MSEARAANAMAYGMMAAEPGIDVLCLGEMGIANTTTAATLCAALFGGTGADWAGPGTGVQGAALGHKIAVIDEALAHHRDGDRRARSADAAGGGRRRGARGHRRRHPRRPHGPHPGAARRLCLHRRGRRAVRRRPPRARPLPGRASLGRARPYAACCEAIGQRPLLDMDMRLGEASGAALAVPILKAAAACHNGMATFAEAGVSGQGMRKKPRRSQRSRGHPAQHRRGRHAGIRAEGLWRRAGRRHRRRARAPASA